MLIKKSQFIEEMKNTKKRKHNLVFLGMSGSRKSHWSKILASEFHYKRVEFDKLIGKSKEFSEVIKNIPGKDEAEKLGKYFGRPWDSRFQSKEDLYLSVERRCMSKKFPLGTLLDLTGSAIYHTEQMAEIAKTGLVVYLEANPSAKQEMLKIYLSGPKPVCWCGVFNKNPNETNKKALARCYPVLLRERIKLYRQFADIRLRYKTLGNIKDSGQFVQEIIKQLA
jgi:shikimate kinase